MDKLLDGREEGGEEQDERRQLSHAEITGQDPLATDQEQHRQAEGGDELGARRIQRTEGAGGDVGVPVVPQDTAVTLDVVALAVGGGDQSDAGQALLQVGEHLGQTPAHGAVPLVGPGAEPQGGHRHGRYDHAQRHQGQGHVVAEQDGGDHHHGEGLHHQVHQTVVEQR